MVDRQGRIAIGTDKLSRNHYVYKGEKVDIYYNSSKRSLTIHSTDEVVNEDESYFIARHVLDDKGRIAIPKVIRCIFDGATFIPTEKNGRIHILIIGGPQKPE